MVTYLLQTKERANTLKGQHFNGVMEEGSGKGCGYVPAADQGARKHIEGSALQRGDGGKGMESSEGKHIQHPVGQAEKEDGEQGSALQRGDGGSFRERAWLHTPCRSRSIQKHGMVSASTG